VSSPQHLPYIILVTNVYYPVIGGISVYVRDLHEELVKHGYDAPIVSFSSRLRHLPRSLRWLFYLAFIIKVFGKALYAKLQGRTVVIHSHSASFCLMAAVLSRKFLGCGAVHTYHSPLDQRSAILEWFTPLLNDVVYVSRVHQKLYHQQKVPIIVNEHIISGGVRLDQFRYVNPVNQLLKSKRPTILFVGRITREKGIAEAISAIELIQQDVELKIVGIAQKPAQKKYLRLQQERVAESELLTQRVRFLGLVQGQDLYDCYSSATIFIAPSIWDEPATLVVPEAMASGLPVVAFSAGGLVERIQHGKNGLLVPRGDIKGLAEAIESILQNTDRLSEMSIHARATAEQKFDLSIALTKYMNIYAQLQ